MKLNKFFAEWAAPIAVGVTVLGASCTSSCQSVIQKAKASEHKSSLKDEPIFITPSF